VLGILAILLGLVFMGVLPWLQRDVRIHQVPAVGLAAAPLLGFLFALGWAPCIGPTLGVILTLAANETGPRGGVLLAFYSLGLGIPFIVAALAWRRALTAFAWVRRHQVWVMRIGGGLLITIGVLLLTGLWAEAVAWVQIQLVSEFEVSV
jgi:cytochrome c-type biogenesis protein